MIYVKNSAERLAGWMLLGVVVVLSACSGDKVRSLPQDDRVLEEGSEGAGALVAEYAESENRGVKSGFNVTGHFIRARGIEAENALDALDVWQPADDLALDSCQTRTGLSEPKGASGETRLEFLDVGDIEVRGPGQEVSLRPRMLPLMPGEFSGVIYESQFEAGEGLKYEPEAVYRFSATGTKRQAGFDVALRAPTPVNLDISESEDSEGGPVQLGWRASPTGGEALSNSVFLEFSTGESSSSPSLRCRLEDDGQFSIPESLVSRLEKGWDLDSDSAHNEDGDYLVTLRRVRSKTVELEGVGISQFVLSAVERTRVDY